jgi:hypothetical protein
LDAPKIKKIKFGDHVIPKNIPETQSWTFASIAWYTWRVIMWQSDTRYVNMFLSCKGEGD